MRRVLGILLLATVVLIGGVVLGYKVGADYEGRVLLPVYSFHDLDDYVSAKGTWVMAEERQAFPLQTSEVTCTRADMLCRGTTAMLNEPADAPFLSILEDIYEVDRWDDTLIVTKPDEKVCVSYTLTVDRRHKQVTAKRTTLDATSDECKFSDLRELNLRLVDGTKSKRLHGR